MIAKEDREHIEHRLERALTQSECLEVQTIDSLSLEHLNVIAELVRKRSGVAALTYAISVVPNEEHSLVRRLVYDIDREIQRRQ